MNIYIALLRGINVGGANKILMADLKALFVSLNLSDPTTYLQSGNVVFSTIREDISAIEIDLKLKILEIFGYNIEVFVLSSSTFRDVYKNNQFIQDKFLDTKKMAVVFLKENPDPNKFDLIKNNPNFQEKMILLNKAIYMYYVNGAGRTKVTNNYFENKLKLKATSRNWNTVRNLVRLFGGN